MSRNVRNWMHSVFNKRPKVSPCFSRKRLGEIRTINVTKYPPNSSPQGDIHRNPNPNLKNNSNTNANLKVTMRCFTLRLAIHFVTSIKRIEPGCNSVHFGT